MESLERCCSKSFRWIKNKTVEPVRSLDIAPSPVTFTFNQESEHKSLFGGVFVLVVVGYLIFTFLSSLKGIYMKQTIIAEKLTKVNPKADTDTTSFARGMMFAIGIEELDFRYEKIFSFSFSSTKKVTKPRNRTQIKRNKALQLYPCTVQVWRNLGLEDFYKANSFEQMLCPDPNEILRLSEVAGYRLEVERCSPQSPAPASSANYDQTLTETYDNFTQNEDWQTYYDETYNTYDGSSDDDYDSIDYTYSTDDYYYDDTNDYSDVESTRVGSSGSQNSGSSASETPKVSASEIPSPKVGAVTPPSYFNAPCYYDFYSKRYGLPRQYRFQFFYVNTKINPEEQDYIQKYVEFQEFLIQLTEHSTLRSEIDFFVDSYEVTTNNNIFNDYEYKMEKKQGLIKVKPAETHSFIYDPNLATSNTNDTSYEKINNFITFDIKKGNDIVFVKRSFLTVHGIFEQIGGYLAFVGGVFAVFFVAYNQLGFELQIVSSLYYQEKDKEIQTADLNYPKFLVYKFWQFLGVFSFKPKWTFCENWQDVSDQASRLLDMRNVVRKIQHLEKVGLALLDEDKYYDIYLQQPPNLQTEKNKLEEDSVYFKLRAKYFSKGEINMKEVENLRKELSKNKEIDDSSIYLNDEVRYNSNKKQESASKIGWEASPQKKKTYQDKKSPADDGKEEEEDDQNQIDEELMAKIKERLLKLKLEAKANDVAARIYQGIDPYVKNILLSEELPKKGMVSMEKMGHETNRDSTVNGPGSSNVLLESEVKKSASKKGQQ